MPFQLIDKSWRETLLKAAAGAYEIQIICPFIKEAVVRDLLDIAKPKSIRVIIERRYWKATWPYYVRIHRAIFVAGSLSNGISLSEMMDALEHETFESAETNFAKGSGTTNPRETMRQAHSRKLSRIGHEWLLQRLNAALNQHGCVPEAV